MTHPLSGSLPKTSGSADLLALFQKSSANAVDLNSGFASVLDQSVKAPQRDPAQREGRQEANRNSEPAPNPGATNNAPPSADARPADASGQGNAQSGQNNQSGSESSSDSRADGRSADADTTGENAEDAVDPATLAVLGAVIAALGGQQAAAEDAEVGDAGDPLADAIGRQRTTPARLQAEVTSTASEDDASLLADAVRGTQDKPGTGLSTKPEPRVAVTTVTQAATVAAPNTSVATPQAAAPLVQAADANPANVAAAMATAPLAGRSAASVQQLPVYTPAGQRGWTEDVGNRLIWMANRGETRAELVLTPPSLGKLGISLQMNGDQTTAHFVAATPAAREALEQAIPRLRELLQQAGINLGQTDVSTSSEQQHARDEAGNTRRGGGQHPIGALAGDANAVDLPVSSGSWVRTGTGMVDTFA